MIIAQTKANRNKKNEGNQAKITRIMSVYEYIKHNIGLEAYPSYIR